MTMAIPDINFGVGSLRGQGWCRGWKLYNHVPRTALPIHLFGHFCLGMYRLATTHSVTDGRQTDRRTNRRQYHANIRSHSVQYDRLKPLANHLLHEAIFLFLPTFYLYFMYDFIFNIYPYHQISVTLHAATRFRFAQNNTWWVNTAGTPITSIQLTVELSILSCLGISYSLPPPLKKTKKTLLLRCFWIITPKKDYYLR